MIVNAFIAIIRAMVETLFSMLPSWNVDGLVASATAGAGHIGQMIGSLDAVLPVSESFVILGIIMTLVPLMLGYTIFKWVWRHIPTIAGFGTGTG